MKYPNTATEYLKSENIRLLIKDNEGKMRCPTLDERVMEAFMAGTRSVNRIYSNLDCFSNNKGNINFPKVNI